MGMIVRILMIYRGWRISGRRSRRRRKRDTKELDRIFDICERRCLMSFLF